MKRLLLSSMLAFCTLLAFAADKVKLVAGSVEALRNAEANIEFVVDYSKTKVEDKTLNEYLRSRGDDFVKDWPSDSKKAREYFVTRYNKKNKKFAQVLESDASKAKYKMVLHVKTMDTGNGGSSFIPMASAKAGGVIVSGCVDVAEKATGKPVCKFDITEAKGLGHMSETVRIGLCYFEIATNMAKIIKKNNESLPISAKDIDMGGTGKPAAKKKATAKKSGTAKKGTAKKTTARKTTTRK